MTVKNSTILSPSELTPGALAVAQAFVRTKPGKLNIAVISDIHLGHRNNPTSEIVKNLMLAFPDNAETASLDIIFLAGDVFDDILMLNDEDVVYIDAWVTYLLRLAKQNNTLIKVLEGTPGHDRNQSTRFTILNDVARIGAPLTYITELCIEHIPEFGLDILYVPDEWLGSTDKALEQAKDLMRAKGIEKVDFAIMHGQFDFQAPAHFNAPIHNSQAYLALVRELIFIGHDHTHKRFERIIAQGSFDRLAHGYEAPKGHMRALWHKDGSWDLTFVENTDAMMFVTIDCADLSLEDTLKKIKEEVLALPDMSYVRIKADSTNPIFSNMETLIRMRPLIEWTKHPQHKKEEEVAPLAETDERYVPIVINSDNLNSLLLERLANNGASGDVMDAAQDMLEELFPWRKKTTEESMKG